jgi:hypothetical protein
VTTFADRALGQETVAERYRFVIADDHPLFRGALRAAVAGPYADAEIARPAVDEVSACSSATATSTSCCSTSRCRACAAFPG